MRWLEGIIDSMNMSLSKLGDDKGRGSLECRIPWGGKESDVTERLNNRKTGEGLKRVLGWRI